MTPRGRACTEGPGTELDSRGYMDGVTTMAPSPWSMRPSQESWVHRSWPESWTGCVMFSVGARPQRQQRGSWLPWYLVTGREEAGREMVKT